MIQFVSTFHMEHGYEFTADFVMTNSFVFNVFIPWLADMGYEGLLGLRAIDARDSNYRMVYIATEIKFNEECQNPEELEVLVRLFLSMQ